jgi:hypothetical protein
MTQLYGIISWLGRHYTLPPFHLGMLTQTRILTLPIMRPCATDQLA